MDARARPEVPRRASAARPRTATASSSAVVSRGDNFLRGRAIGLDAKSGSICGASKSCPARASRGTRRGRRTATSGNTAAARCGRRRRSTRRSGSSISRPATPCRSGAASCARATIFTTTRSSRSTSRRARGAGTSRPCITTSGRPTSARRSCSTTRPSAAGRARCSWRDAYRRRLVLSSIAKPASRCFQLRSGRQAGHVAQDVADPAVHEGRRSHRSGLRGQERHSSRLSSPAAISIRFAPTCRT